MLYWQNVVYFILDESTVYECMREDRLFYRMESFQVNTSCIPYPNIPAHFHAYMINLVLFTHCFLSCHSTFKTISTPLYSNFHLCSKHLEKTCFSLFQHIKTIYRFKQHALEITLMQDLCSCRQHRAYDSFKISKILQILRMSDIVRRKKC